MIDRESLFTYQQNENEKTYEGSSVLGEYVIHQLPSDLDEVRRGELTYDELARKHEELLAGVGEQILAISDYGAAAVTQLDLVFIMGSYLPDGNFHYCPKVVREFIEYQADKFQLNPFMDFDMVININSAEYEKTGHMRTFTSGKTARGERDFYYGHYLSERHILKAAEMLKGIVDGDMNVAGLQDIYGEVQDFRVYMGRYAKLSRDAFETFRPYLSSYPDGTRNASGAFMPSVQLAELALHTPSAAQQTYIRESLLYFPREAAKRISQWQAESIAGQNVVTLVDRGEIILDDKEREALEKLVSEFLLFRTTHLAVTRQQIPEAFVGRSVPVGRRQYLEFGEPDIMADGERGTAGFDVVNILGGSASRLARLHQEIQEFRNGKSD